MLEKPKILIVDDVPANVLVLAALLDDLNIELYQSFSGDDALSLILENDISLILLDVQMPGMSGFEVAKYLQSFENTKNIPIYFISANEVSVQKQIEGFDIGAMDYFIKPINESLFLSKINVFVHQFEQKRDLELKARNFRKAEVILSAIPDPVLRVQGNKILYMNEAAIKVAGHISQIHNCETIEQLFGFSQENYVKIDNLIAKTLNSDIAKDSVVDLSFGELDHGDKFPYEFRVMPLRSGDDSNEITLIFHDVTDIKHLSNKLTQQAFHDALTGCLNRRALQENFYRVTARHARSHHNFSVMLLDLDDFKRINDTAGHEAGDKALRLAVERINGCLRDVDSLYRIGGDEFCVLLEDTEQLDSLVTPASRIIAAFEPSFVIDNSFHQMGVSIGITSTLIDEQHNTIDMLIDADMAMYAAKEAGKNCYKFFSIEMRKKLNYKDQLKKDLIMAVAKSEFSLLYQPQINIKTTECVGLEVFLRWNHPKHGLLTPDAFLLALEGSTLINTVGLWVVEESCRQIVKWKVLGLKVPTIFVNVSAIQFEEQDFASLIFDIIKRYGLEPSSLGIEITEDLFMSSTVAIEENLQRLSRDGFQIALDDFGTGYSSLKHLLRFPINIIKIDRLFTQDILTQPSYQDMIRAVVHLAHGFKGMKVLCEGIEKTAVLALLREFECDYYQGYLFSPLLIADDMEEKLKDCLLAQGAYLKLC